MLSPYTLTDNMLSPWPREKRTFSAEKVTKTEEILALLEVI